MAGPCPRTQGPPPPSPGSALGPWASGRPVRAARPGLRSIPLSGSAGEASVEVCPRAAFHNAAAGRPGRKASARGPAHDCRCHRPPHGLPPSPRRSHLPSQKPITLIHLKKLYLFSTRRRTRFRVNNTLCFERRGVELHRGAGLVFRAEAVKDGDAVPGGEKVLELHALSRAGISRSREESWRVRLADAPQAFCFPPCFLS